MPSESQLLNFAADKQKFTCSWHSAPYILEQYIGYGKYVSSAILLVQSTLHSNRT